MFDESFIKHGVNPSIISKDQAVQKANMCTICQENQECKWCDLYRK